MECAILSRSFCSWRVLLSSPDCGTFCRRLRARLGARTASARKLQGRLRESRSGPVRASGKEGFKKDAKPRGWQGRAHVALCVFEVRAVDQMRRDEMRYRRGSIRIKDVTWLYTRYARLHAGSGARFRFLFAAYWSLALLAMACPITRFHHRGRGRRDAARRARWEARGRPVSSAAARTQIFLLNTRTNCSQLISKKS